MKKNFVVLCYPRSGSYLLTDLLGRQETVACYGELFKPGWIELDPSLLEKLGFDSRDVKKREENPLEFLENVVNLSQEEMVGFKIFPPHNQLVISTLLTDPNTNKIFLGRNPLQSFFSLELAKKSNQWTKTDAQEPAKLVNIDFNQAQFFDYLMRQKSFYERTVYAAKTISANRILFIDYPDLQDVVKMQELAHFLGLEEWKVISEPKFKKQLDRPYEELVSNWADVESFCSVWNCNVSESFYDFMSNVIGTLYADKVYS